MYQQPGTLLEIEKRKAPQQATHRQARKSEACISDPLKSDQLQHKNQGDTATPPQCKLTGAGAGLGSSPAPHCSPRRAPDLPGDGGTPAGSISAPSCHSPGPGCACWSSQAVIEDSGGPGATSHTQASSRTSKDARFRMGTCRERKHHKRKTGSTTARSISFEQRR